MLGKIVGLYYETNDKGRPNAGSDWITKMVHAVSEAGFFNTDRMVAEYQEKVWSP
jgi:glucan phosphorylase